MNDNPPPLHRDPGSKSQIEFEFDLCRGGFILAFGKPDWRNEVRMFGGLAAAFLNDEGKIVHLESFWDHGGVPIRALHITEFRIPDLCFRGGDFTFTDQTLVAELFQIHQQPNHLAFWFGRERHMPLPHWTFQRHPELGVDLYFSSRRAKGGWPVPRVVGRREVNLLAGIELPLDKTVAQYPISLVRFTWWDLK